MSELIETFTMYFSLLIPQRSAYASQSQGKGEACE